MHMIFVKAIQVTDQIYTDQTRNFPITSSHGNKYIMVLYDYDSNTILTKPLKSRSKAEMIQGYSNLHDLLSNRGLKPVLQKPDNEAPVSLKPL
jgi:hypothetical protein